ncbi:MAG TPA: FtsQ-type POTRA domain-containing protein [Candidatus Methylacidiphilales bacterium]|jgi:cell division septal protein FtsQ|nr:FtsQ-type POTRA domain-containing protein [Candidatus Methylacidiphilales bacterium]
MNRRTRTRQKQINILHTTTRKRHSRKQVMQAAVWCSLVLAMIVAVGAALHFGITLALDRVLYTNPRYELAKIEIEPRGRFSERQIRQAAGLQPGQNLWTLNLRRIARDLEKLPYVSSAKVERHFPDAITIHIIERVPAVKIVGLDIDLGTRELFYLDRDGVVLKPRADETPPLLPEIVGLAPAQSELEPGVKLDQPGLKSAMKLLDAIDHSQLHTAITIQTINLSDPLSIKMVTTQDMTVVFRVDDTLIDQELQRLLRILNDPRFQRPIASVDLTLDYNDPITFAQYQ